MTRRAIKIPQRYLTRTIKAAQAAGMRIDRIEVYGSDKIALIPATSVEKSASLTEFVIDRVAQATKKGEWD